MTATATDLPATGSLSRIDELLGRRVSMRALALLRILVGPIVLLHLWPFLDSALDGRIYRDTFYEPYASWYPELTRGVYVALLWTGAVVAASTARCSSSSSGRGRPIARTAPSVTVTSSATVRPVNAESRARCAPPLR